MNLIRVKGATVTHVAYWGGPFQWRLLCSPRQLVWVAVDDLNPDPSPICKDCRKALTRMATKVNKWEEQ